MEVKQIDNKGDNTIKNFLQEMIDNNSQVSISTSRFSIYAIHAIQDAIKGSKSFNVLLNEDYFDKPDTGFLRRYEWAQSRENLMGNQFEIKLRNQMNTSFIARETAKVLRNHANFKKLNPQQFPYQQCFIENSVTPDKSVAITNDFELTGDGLGLTPSNRWNSTPAICGEPSIVQSMMANFRLMWDNRKEAIDANQEVLQQIEELYEENSPQWIYYISLYHLFHQELDELDEESVIREGSGFKDTKIWKSLYEFQKDGVIGLIKKIEKYNGAILADSVGLGKTYSALAVIKYYELKNDRVLVLAPKRLRDNWTIYTQNDKRNSLADDRFNYDVLNHTDLSRYSGMSGDINLKTLNWSAYDLIVIDESHNFRNNNPTTKETPTRYQRLMNEVIKAGGKTKVLMLSATPVNNRMNDIKNQIAFITEDNPYHLADYGVGDINNELKKAQGIYNEWAELEAEDRTTQNFLDKVNPGYFKILDLLTIARSRKHIEKYYDSSEIGKFPTRREPMTLKPDIDLSGEFMEIKVVHSQITQLYLALYKPFQFLLPEMKRKYAELYDTQVKDGQTTFLQSDREEALIGLIRSNLLKRLESSIDSFKLTVERIIHRIESYLNQIKEAQKSGAVLASLNDFSEGDDALDDFQEDELIGGKTKVLLGDMDLLKWQFHLEQDLIILKDIYQSAARVTVEKDGKLHKLKEVIADKFQHPLNPGNKKIIIFTAFSDTANYLYDNLAQGLLNKYGLHSALITGGGHQKTTLDGISTKDMNDLLIHFSPKSKERDKIYPDASSEIDILIATDAISEGQNLQDCDFLINYDIHWNPVRVIQRFGRIDRIGSVNDQIQLVNFWPNMDLDEYINLESRVKGRMVLLNTAATGEEDLLNVKNQNEMNDLQYRRNQLKQLQEEVVDIEDINGAISITDITYSDYKADLTNALKDYEAELVEAPKGMYAISKSSLVEKGEAGVIFLLKQNQASLAYSESSLLPYLLIYMRDDGSVKINHTKAKDILHYFKLLCHHQDQVLQEQVDAFNQLTGNGQQMDPHTELLNHALEAIKGKKEETGRLSLFTPGGTKLSNDSESINVDEVELISFLIITED